MKRLLIAGACLLLSTSVAEAQTCFGAEDAKLSAGVDAEFGSAQTGIAGGVTDLFGSGNLVFLVKGGLALNHISGVSAGTGFFGVGGLVLAPKSKKFTVCPAVGYTKLFGQDPGDGVNISPAVLSFGASVGVPWKTINTTQIVPLFGFFVNHVTENIGGGTIYGTTTASGSYGATTNTIHAGAGLIFNEKMALVPVILFYLGSNVNSHVAFSVNFDIKIH